MASSTHDSLPLRARKAAYTRLALMDAVVARLGDGPLDAVNVRACCAEVGVSAPTFFNYFGDKAGALVFYVYLWSIEAQWHLERATSARTGLQELFDLTAERVRESPGVLPEVITAQLRAGAVRSASDRPQLAPPTVADLRLRFPDLSGIDTLAPVGIDRLFAAAIDRAVVGGELPATTDAELAQRLLLSLFFGAAASMRDPGAVADTLSRGLDLLWRGLSDPSSTRGTR